jgi:hypothetical protein
LPSLTAFTSSVVASLFLVDFVVPGKHFSQDIRAIMMSVV